MKDGTVQEDLVSRPELDTPHLQLADRKVDVRLGAASLLRTGDDLEHVIPDGHLPHSQEEVIPVSDQHAIYERLIDRAVVPFDSDENPSQQPAHAIRDRVGAAVDDDLLVPAGQLAYVDDVVHAPLRFKHTPGQHEAACRDVFDRMSLERHDYRTTWIPSFWSSRVWIITSLLFASRSGTAVYFETQQL